MASSNFSIDAKRDLNNVLKDDQEKDSVNVYEFDPSASPQQKAAVAAKGRQQLKSISRSKAKDVGAKGAWFFEL